MMDEFIWAVEVPCFIPQGASSLMDWFLRTVEVPCFIPPGSIIADGLVHSGS
jgi:hypothetical protein